MRQLFIDTETTGLSPRHGHRVIEIACVEMVDGRLTSNDYHAYLDPERSVPAEAEAVHGLNDSFLLGQPLFSNVAPALMAFIADAHVLHRMGSQQPEALRFRNSGRNGQKSPAKLVITDLQNRLFAMLAPPCWPAILPEPANPFYGAA